MLEELAAEFAIKPWQVGTGTDASMAPTPEFPVAILFVTTVSSRTLRTCIGVAYKRSCILFNISGSFAAPRKTVKPIKQRLWPKMNVAGRLAARGLFAARLCM